MTQATETFEHFIFMYAVNYAEVTDNNTLKHISDYEDVEGSDAIIELWHDVLQVERKQNYARYLDFFQDMGHPLKARDIKRVVRVVKINFQRLWN